MARIRRRRRRSQGETRRARRPRLRQAVARALRRRRHRTTARRRHALDRANASTPAAGRRDPRHARQRFPGALDASARRDPTRPGARGSPDCAMPALGRGDGAVHGLAQDATRGRVRSALFTSLRASSRLSRHDGGVRGGEGGLFAWPRSGLRDQRGRPFGTRSPTRRARGRRVLTYGLDRATSRRRASRRRRTAWALDRDAVGRGRIAPRVSGVQRVERAGRAGCAARERRRARRRARHFLRASRRRREGCNDWAATRCRVVIAMRTPDALAKVPRHSSRPWRRGRASACSVAGAGAIRQAAGDGLHAAGCPIASSSPTIIRAARIPPRSRPRSSGIHAASGTFRAVAGSRRGVRAAVSTAGQATWCSSRAKVTGISGRDGVRTPFSDAEVATAALHAWTARAAQEGPDGDGRAR